MGSEQKNRGKRKHREQTGASVPTLNNFIAYLGPHAVLSVHNSRLDQKISDQPEQPRTARGLTVKLKYQSGRVLYDTDIHLLGLLAAVHTFIFSNDQKFDQISSRTDKNLILGASGPRY
jgi:hypothetical protein